MVTASVLQSSPQNESSQAAGKAINDFGLKLVREVVAQETHKNVFVSPLSVFVALTMAETGSAGKTQEAMRQALAVPASLSEDELHEAVSTLLKSLKSEKGVELSIANALWSDAHWPLGASFIQQCRKFYDAQATTLDFNQASATSNAINKWVNEKTRGKIPTIVTPAIVHAAKAVLTNAVYFKARWQYVFDKDQTTPSPFHLAGGEEKNVPMMHRSSIQGAYRSGDGFEAAALPYASSEMRLYAILPAPGKNPEEVLAGISIEKLSSPAEPNELDLRMPRFTLDFSSGLKATLEHMGMAEAFQAGADFKPMGSRNFFIGDVLHKTRLEVDEEGTVAAAATGVIVLHASRPRPAQKKVLVFDRPFGLLLCDGQGTILFAGVVYEP